MGTLVRAVVETSETSRAHAALLAAFARLRELDQILSDYQPDSELNRLCRAGSMRVSPDLFHVLEFSQQLSEWSGGAFDITYKSRQNGSSYRDISMYPGSLEVRLPDTAMRLDVGAVGKGYAADAMVKVMRANGCRRALAALSGDIVVGDGDWRIQLQGSGETRMLRNCGVSTSGDTEREHIRDGRTGEYVRDVWLVSVLARSGMVADGLSTTLRIVGEKDGRELARKLQAQAWFRHVG